MLRRMQQKDRSPAISNLMQEQRDALLHELLKWQEQRSSVQQKDPKVAEFGSLLNFQRPALRHLTQEQREALLGQFLKWQEQRSSVQQQRSGVPQQRSSVPQ
jgi:uncharacterized protein YeaC (DUF1315 family)